MQTKPPTTNNEETPGVLESPTDMLADMLINLLDLGSVVHQATNLVMSRRPQIERAIDALTYGETRKGMSDGYEALAVKISESVFCDDVDQDSLWVLDLANRILVIFLTIRHNKRIAIIKEMREATGFNIKDSKKVVDRIFQSQVALPPSLVETFGMTEELKQRVKDYEKEVQRQQTEIARQATKVRELQQIETANRTSIDRLYKRLDILRDQLNGLREVTKLATSKLFNPHKTIVEGAAKAVEQKAIDQRLELFLKGRTS